MAEIRLQIPDDVIANLQEKLTRHTKPTDIARDAINLYTWVVNEAAHGRVLLTSNSEGTDFTKVAMPSLDSIMQRN